MLSKQSFNKLFCMRTKEIRERTNRSPKDVADFLRIKPDTYLRYETRSPLPHYLIPPFCKLFEIQVDMLMRVEETARPAVKRRPFRDTRRVKRLKAG